MNAPYYLVGGTESILPGVKVWDIQRSFTRVISSYLPNNPIVWVGLDEVRNGLSAQVNCAKNALGPNAFVVSLSTLYFSDADREVSCTRIVDADFNSLGLAARPPSEDLSQQVKSIIAEAKGRPIIVVDDTLFHGQTIIFLKELGLPIHAAVEYFSAKNAVKTLEALGVQIFTVCTLDDYLDVMPLHDFLPIMPLCGKLLGEAKAEGLQYCGFGTDLSMSVPYIMPYISATMVGSWASIPWEYARDFSAFALTQSMILVERMNQVGMYTVADVKRRQPHRVSIPFLEGSTDEDNVLLSDVIRRAVHMSFCL